MGYWLEGWTGDNAGPVVGRQSNTLFVTESMSEDQWTYAWRKSIQVQGKTVFPEIWVACMTPGARHAQVIGVEHLGRTWNSATWSLRIAEMNLGDERDPWERGVHLFSVAVACDITTQKDWQATVPFASTLATAVIDRVSKVDLTESGAAIEWIEAMNQLPPPEKGRYVPPL